MGGVIGRGNCPRHPLSSELGFSSIGSLFRELDPNFPLSERKLTCVIFIGGNHRKSLLVSCSMFCVYRVHVWSEVVRGMTTSYCQQVFPIHHLWRMKDGNVTVMNLTWWSLL